MVDDMCKLEWITENTTINLILGNDLLVNLVQESNNESKAYIFDKKYIIQKPWLTNTFLTISLDNEVIASINFQVKNENGYITFKDKTVFYYSFSLTKGLKIYIDKFRIDSIDYQGNFDKKNNRTSVKIGIDIADLDIDRLLILLTLGKILYDFFIKTYSKSNI